ncbi:MAG: hypothetical protein JWP94_2426 [Mucilaginibacter sp.]|nr:hypothetical protein [Mucilaginibacter sp.]
MFNRFILSILLLAAFQISRAQTSAYPKVTGYFSIVQPLTTWTKDGFASNFGNVYVVGFPFGVNLLKSNSFGINFEMAPTIRTEKNISKVNSVLFHPGAMFRFKHGFTFIGRMAFETNGRFGVTPVFNQVIKKGKDASLFISVPFPVRFGNDQPVSVGTGLQVGVSF